jgi:hypothetical protein
MLSPGGRWIRPGCNFFEVVVMKRADSPGGNTERDEVPGWCRHRFVGDAIVEIDDAQQQTQLGAASRRMLQQKRVDDH